jgi:hypothetical protein
MCTEVSSAIVLCCAFRARNVFMANVSVGETVLKTAPLTLEMPLSVYEDANDFAGQPVTQMQQQQLAAVPQLLCTGEVEDVRGDAGTFPQSLALLDSKQQSIYHPRGALTLAAGCTVTRGLSAI